MTPRGRHSDTPPRWTRFRVGLLAIVLIAIGVYFGFTKDIPFTHGYYLHAVFESSNNLRPGSPVRIAGVNVGKVKSVERYKATNLTEVTMEIDDIGLPIHQRRDAQDPPAHLPRGQLLRRPQARARRPRPRCPTAA